MLIWSGNTIVTKAAAAAIDPASIALYRWVLAFLILTPFALRPILRNRDIVRQNWLKLATLGALGMAVYQGLAYNAAKTTSATNMGVMQALMPLLSALLAGALAAERLTRWRIAGAVSSLAGLVIMTTHGRAASLLEHGPSPGDALMLIAVTANSLYGVLLKRWSIPLPTWQQMYVQIAFAIALLFPFWLLGPMNPITAANAPMILYAAIPASLAAPFCWITGVKRLGAARTALFINLLPPLVALVAWTTLHETLDTAQLAGAALALLGVSLGLRQPATRAITPAAPSPQDQAAATAEPTAR